MTSTEPPPRRGRPAGPVATICLSKAAKPRAFLRQKLGRVAGAAPYAEHEDPSGTISYVEDYLNHLIDIASIYLLYDLGCFR